MMFRGPYSNDHGNLTGSSSANQFQRMARQTEVSLEKDVDRSWRILSKRTISEKESETLILGTWVALDEGIFSDPVVS